MRAGTETGDRLQFKLQPQQSLAFSCPGNEILYGGAAGGGKSHLMRIDAIYHCTAVAGCQAFIFRRNYGDLHLNHMEGPTSFPELLAPLANQGKCSIVGNEIRFWNGSKIHLCHLQYTKSLQKYQGAEIHWLGIDELTHFKDKEYRYLRGRVRLGGLVLPEGFRGRLPRIVCGTNPGSVGHNWVKNTFIRLGPMRVVQMPKSEGRMRRVFIPARLEDNPALMDNDPEYENRLEALGDPLLVRAMREGDWDVVADSMFGATWRKKKHVCAAFPIPIDWKIWRGADDGFAAPAACYWLAEEPKTGKIYVIAEIYRSRMLPDFYASEILRIDGQIPREINGEVVPNTVPLDGLMDSAAFSNNGQSETPRGKQIVKAGAKFRPVEKWAGSVIHRVQDFHRRLAANPRDPSGGPGIVFFENCKFAIRTIPVLPRDDKQIETIDTNAEDHCFVAGTLVGTPSGPRPIEELKPGDLVSTRWGAYPVAANWITKNQPVVTNRGMTGTLSHPVWTKNGYLPLALLTPSDTLCTWKKWKRRRLAGSYFGGILIHPGEKIGTITALQAAMLPKGLRRYTERSIRRISEQFRREATSITETVTLATILQRTLLALAPRSTRKSIFQSDCQSCAKTSKKRKQRLLNGMAARLAGNGILSTRKGQQRRWQKRRILADSAEWNSCGNQSAEDTFAAQRAPQNTGDKAGKMTWQRSAGYAPKNSSPTDFEALKLAADLAGLPWGTADVFNLTVDGPGEFFANGTLVLQSFDAVTYGLQWRSMRAKKRRLGGI